MSGRAGIDTGCQRPNASSIDASRSIKLAVIACTSFRAAVLICDRLATRYRQLEAAIRFHGGTKVVAATGFEPATSSL